MFSFLFIIAALVSVMECLNVLDAKVYVINMKNRSDKLAVSKFQLDLLGMNFTAIDAVNGTEVKAASNRSLGHEKVGQMIGIPDLRLKMDVVRKSELWPSQLGCFLSHLKALNEIASQKEESMSLVFEDDFLADGSAIETMNKQINRLPSDWDLVHFGHCEGRWRCVRYLDREQTLCQARNMVICTHAYLLRTRSSAKKLFDTGNRIPPTNADFFFHLAGINRYMVFPPTFSQRKNIVADTNSPFAPLTPLSNNTIEVLVNKIFS